MSNESGSGKGFPSQDRALQKTHREVKQREEALHRERTELEKAQKRIKQLEKEYRKLLSEMQKFSFQKPKHPELQRLSKRLIKYRGELFVFIKSGVDVTNNAAEREIRPAVLMRKTSYGNRSDQGAHNQAVLMSIIRTASKKGINFTQMAASYFCT